MYNPQWKLFDTDNSEGAVWTENNFANGVWNGGTSSIFTLANSYYGDWIHIQLPDPIVLSSCSFTARTGHESKAPSKFRIYGSNDGTAWTILHDQTSAVPYSGGKASVTVQSTSMYTYFALVVSAVPAGGTIMNFMKWRIFARVSHQFVYYLCFLGFSLVSAEENPFSMHFLHQKW
jgi:hypothetical protein